MEDTLIQSFKDENCDEESNLYSKNVFNFVENLYDKEKKNIKINLEDEIISKTLIK